MINNSVMKCCICNNENIGEFIIINKNKYHLCCIEQLKEQRQELRSWLEEDKDKINVLDAKNNGSVKLGIVIGLGMCLDKLNELEGGNNE